MSTTPGAEDRRLWTSPRLHRPLWTIAEQFGGVYDEPALRSWCDCGSVPAAC